MEYGHKLFRSLQEIGPHNFKESDTFKTCVIAGVGTTWLVEMCHCRG